ncbi:MAG: AAA family ATPase [Desulfovibrionaceae bacterium]|nr:AAA family ATPase [Desulfovibrionaceae bacterium]
MLKQNLISYLNQCQPAEFVRQWFEPISIGKNRSNESWQSETRYEDDASEQEEVIRVSFPHKLFGQCFMLHARNHFEQAANHCFGSQIKIEYVFDRLSPVQTYTGPGYKSGRLGGVNHFSFASFIGSGDNQFALETAQGIARGNIAADIFNPFCVYGKTGCGKTHLLSALAKELKEQHNQMVFMSSAKELADLFGNGGSNYLTRQKILANQAFILDDLQQIENNIELQDELVILFDHFYVQGKIVAFGINCPPDRMDGIIFPLLNRLQRGVCAALRQPDLELRSVFVRNRAKNCGLPLNEKQVLNLATQFTSLRRLEGLINRAVAFSYAQGKKLSNRDLEKLIRDAGGVSLSELTSQTIIDTCSENLNVSISDIIGSKRSKEVTQARQIAMYLCRDLLGSSYPELGNIFGGKDQSTAMYSVKKIEQIMRVDKDTHKLVTNLKSMCLGLENRSQ